MGHASWAHEAARDRVTGLQPPGCKPVTAPLGTWQPGKCPHPTGRKVRAGGPRPTTQEGVQALQTWCVLIQDSSTRPNGAGSPARSPGGLGTVGTSGQEAWWTARLHRLGHGSSAPPTTEASPELLQPGRATSLGIHPPRSQPQKVGGLIPSRDSLSEPPQGQHCGHQVTAVLRQMWLLTLPAHRWQASE